MFAVVKRTDSYFSEQQYCTNVSRGVFHGEGSVSIPPPTAAGVKYIRRHMTGKEKRALSRGVESTVPFLVIDLC